MFYYSDSVHENKENKAGTHDGMILELGISHKVYSGIQSSPDFLLLGVSNRPIFILNTLP